MSCFAIEHKAGEPQGGYTRVSVSPTKADGCFPRAPTISGHFTVKMQANDTIRLLESLIKT